MSHLSLVMASTSGQAPRLASCETESYIDNKRKNDIRCANIVAAQAVADAIRTSLSSHGVRLNPTPSLLQDQVLR
ncbi:hypothetical protein RHMOL_Rhmol10G0272500 [Rhododendron molle]|uniref:Uncharacterized protein n=1 Tax=Rhododendron molle TaxID=49168 RepID=A0ACC0M6I2_RHOML|nr:hypothetical protein RHMOL_Rhmol10G0272500 [Rhododendron molle]